MATLFERVSLIAPELVIFLYAIGNHLFWPIFSQLLANKLCVEVLHFPTCANLTRAESDELRVTWARWYANQNLVQAVPYVAASLVIATWGDRFSRRWPLVLPPIGSILQVTMVLGAYYWKSYWSIWLLLSSSIVYDLTGCHVMMASTVSACVADATPGDEIRTMRLAFVSVADHIGQAAGSFLGAILIDTFALPVSFFTFAAVNAFIIGFVALFISEPEREQKRSSEKHATSGLWFVVKDIWRLLTRPRPNGARTLLWLMVLLSLMMTLAGSGNSALIQPYLETAPFNWTLPQFMTFGSLQKLGLIAVLFGVIPLLKRVLKWHDATMGVLGCVLVSASWLAFSLARTSSIIYATLPLNAFSSLINVAGTAISSKLVDGDEQATMFVVLSTVLWPVGVLVGLLAAATLQWSLAFWAGLWFGVSSALYMCPLVLFLYVRRRMRLPVKD